MIYYEPYYIIYKKNFQHQIKLPLLNMKNLLWLLLVWLHLVVFFYLNIIYTLRFTP
jgi:hypothetical protein